VPTSQRPFSSLLSWLPRPSTRLPKSSTSRRETRSCMLLHLTRNPVASSGKLTQSHSTKVFDAWLLGQDVRDRGRRLLSERSRCGSTFPRPGAWTPNECDDGDVPAAEGLAGRHI